MSEDENRETPGPLVPERRLDIHMGEAPALDVIMTPPRRTATPAPVGPSPEVSSHFRPLRRPA